MDNQSKHLTDIEEYVDQSKTKGEKEHRNSKSKSRLSLYATWFSQWKY